MTPNSVICPQCGGPLPRQALWRAVVCTYCGVEVTRSESIVRAERFHEAYRRAQAALHGPDLIRCAGQHYRIVAPLATGGSNKVLLADRAGAFPERVVLKIATAASVPGRLKHEAGVLEALQADMASGSAYFSQRLPQVVAYGTADDEAGQARTALVMRNPTGFWGSLAAVAHNYPRGIDSRHAVWMWRRALEVLGYVHDRGWVHGRLAPEHWLVHPGDHGILLTGWADAAKTHAASSVARDLAQTAWTVRLLLSGHADDAVPALPAVTPRPFAVLIARACEDLDWCARLGARGLDRELVAAAQEAFGAPKFIDFDPVPPA